MNKKIINYPIFSNLFLIALVGLIIPYDASAVLSKAKRETIRNTMVSVDNVWCHVNPQELESAIAYAEKTGNLADVTAGAVNTLRRFEAGHTTVNLLDYGKARNAIKNFRKTNTARRDLHQPPVYRTADDEVVASAKGCVTCGDKTPVVFINHEPRLISANNIRYSTLVIDEPGYYILTQDAEFNPTFPDVFMISIEADNVILDLNTKLLTQLDSNTNTGINGIRIASGHSNVTVKNGAIIGITGIGVVVEENCCSINLCDLVVKYAEFGGIYFVGSDPAGTTCLLDSPFQPSDQLGRIVECVIKNCQVLQSHGTVGQTLLRGLALINCDDFTIEDCNFNNNGSAGLDRVRALSGADSNNINVVNCQMNENSADALECVGCFLLHCQNWHLTDCAANKNICFNGATEGFTDAGGKGNLFEACVANANVAPVQNVIGFKTIAIDFNVEHATFNTCQANGGRAGTGAIGFAAYDGSIGNVYNACLAIDNAGGVTLPPPDEAAVGSDINAGFVLLKAEHCIIMNSTAQETHAFDPAATTSGLTFGILIAPDFDLDLAASPTTVTPLPSYNVIKNNTIINNVGTVQTIIPFLSGTPFTVKSFGMRYLDFATFLFGEVERPLHGPLQVVTDLIINNFAYGNGTVANRDCNYDVAPYAIGSFPVTCGNIGDVVPVTSAETLDNIEIRVGSC